jgi:hypothetical protein
LIHKYLDRVSVLPNHSTTYFESEKQNNWNALASQIQAKGGRWVKKQDFVKKNATFKKYPTLTSNFHQTEVTFFQISPSFDKMKPFRIRF